LDDAFKSWKKILGKKPIVLLGFLAGLTREEVAVELAISKSSVQRQWRFLGAWFMGAWLYK